MRRRVELNVKQMRQFENSPADEHDYAPVVSPFNDPPSVMVRSPLGLYFYGTVCWVLEDTERLRPPDVRGWKQTRCQEIPNARCLVQVSYLHREPRLV